MDMTLFTTFINTCYTYDMYAQKSERRSHVKEKSICHNYVAYLDEANYISTTGVANNYNI